jgi:hypothetical protein
MGEEKMGENMRTGNRGRRKRIYIYIYIYREREREEIFGSHGGYIKKKTNYEFNYSINSVSSSPIFHFSYFFFSHFFFPHFTYQIIYHYWSP